MRFSEWLIEQKDRDDDIGAMISKYIIGKSVQIDSWYDLNDYLIEQHATKKEIKACQRCWIEFTIGHQIRVDKPPEEITMTAHQGTCGYCGGIVKMFREIEPPFKLQLNNCSCLQCGQRYFVKLKPHQTVEDFEREQWRQKGQTFAMGGD